MSVGTRVDSVLGEVTTNNSAGYSIAKSTSNYGFAPYKVDSVTSITATGAVTTGDAGVFNISGSSALTVTMPLASSCAGAMLTFRATSKDAHVLTGSAEALGTKVFCDATTVGASLTFKTSVVDEAVSLLSDGAHFMVMGCMSGSYTIA